MKGIMVCLSLSLSLLIITPNFALANLPEEILSIEYQTTNPRQTSQKIQIKMLHLPNPQGEPVLMTHAMTLSFEAMRNLGELLHKEGYDVWMPNMRGHGLGQYRSSVVDTYIPGSYGFDPIVLDDYPEIFREVHTRNPKPMHIIGFSMGGMTWEQFLSGVHRGQNGYATRSEELARERSEAVKSFTELVVPPDLKGVSHQVQNLLTPFKFLFRKNHFFVPFSLFQGGLLSLLDPLLLYVIPCGIIAKDEYDLYEDEWFDLVNHQLSNPHTDYVNDIMYWFEKPYGSRDGGVSYEVKELYVPTLMIAAEKDTLAPSSHIWKKAQNYKAPKGLWYVKVLGAGHLDVIFRPNLEKYKETLLNFLKDPDQQPPKAISVKTR